MNIDNSKPNVYFGSGQVTSEFDIFTFKRQFFRSISGSATENKRNRGRVGLPLQFDMCEQLPLWDGFFRSLGFEVVFADVKHTNGKIMDESLRVCFSAKLLSEQIASLLNNPVDFIFLPCESYNSGVAEDNFYCSVIAFYPEILKVLDGRLTDDNFITPYLDLYDIKSTAKKLYCSFSRFKIRKKSVKKAMEFGFSQLKKYRSGLKERAELIVETARQTGKQIVMLVGRPYLFALQSKIYTIFNSYDVAVISDDIVYENSDGSDQIAYIERLFRAAEYCRENADVSFAHIISSGCGIDKIIAEEVRAVVERSGKQYIFIKVDMEGIDDIE